MSFKVVACGRCPSCGKTLIRQLPADYGVCDCSSVTEIRLEPAILIWGKTLKMARRIAKEKGVTVDKAALAILRFGFEKAKGMSWENILAVI